LGAFESFFAGRGHAVGLRKQVAGVAKRGFPPVPPPVLALLALEAATGVLMGVQDADAIREHVTLDVLPSPGSFVGMRGDAVECAAGELVVRDTDGVIASVFQGPDKRTAVGPASKNLLFYVFDSHPSLGPDHAEAVDAVVSLVSGSATTTTVAGS
ncbi:MAG TPA: hypothetical protein VIY26_14800, partial [Acidimicrobiales bacterium]